MHLAILSNSNTESITTHLLEIWREKGLPLDQKDSRGFTALHWGIALQKLEISQKLLEAGADVNALDNQVFHMKKIVQQVHKSYDKLLEFLRHKIVAVFTLPE